MARYVWLWLMMTHWLTMVWGAPLGHADEAVHLEWIASVGGRATTDSDGHLIAVDLRHCWLTDPDLMRVGEMTNLHSIQLGYTKVTDQGVEYLKPLTKVQQLDLHYAESISDAGLAHLKGWHNLRRLNMRGTKVTSTLFDHLVGMSQLEELDVGFSRVNDDNFERLSELPKLRRLDIGGNKMSGAALLLLKLIPTLRELNLGGQQRTDSGLWAVALTDPNCEVLASLTALESLDVSDTTVGDRGLQRLATLKNLQRLRLARTKVTSKGIAGLTGLSQLRELDCEGVEGIDNAILRHCGHMTALQLLQLDGTQVTVDALLQADKPPALKRLTLNRISAADQQKLAGHWPNVDLLIAK